MMVFRPRTKCYPIDQAISRELLGADKCDNGEKGQERVEYFDDEPAAADERIAIFRFRLVCSGSAYPRAPKLTVGQSVPDDLMYQSILRPYSWFVYFEFR